MAGEEKSLPDILFGARGGDNSPEMLMFDLPNLFDVQAGGVGGAPRAPKNKSGKMTVDLNCVSFSKVLVLWRPWENCPRCHAAMQENEVVFPDDDDYTCPHTQEKEYKRIKDLCLCGVAVLQKEEFFNVRSNDARCVHILWWCLDDASTAKLKARKAGDAVFPPNPEAVFAKGAEEDKKKEKKVKKTRDVEGDNPVS